MVSGIELRKRFEKELESDNQNKISEEFNSSNESYLKNLKELMPEAEIDGIDKKRFSLFNPKTSVEKKHLSNATYISINIKEKKDVDSVKIIDNISSVYLTLKLEKNASCNLVFLMKSKSSALFIEAFLEDNSSAKITCISNGDELLTRYNAICEKNSNFTVKNLSLSSSDSESKIILEDDTSSRIINSYLNKNAQSKSNDIMIHKGKNSDSKILSKSYLINSKLDSRGLIRI
jgi:Fe-S cluster assembly scaffold protein SufB